MRRPLVLALALGLAASLLGGTPAGAILPAGFDCAPDDGREQLTTDGFELTFEAPAPPVPELAATANVTGPGVSAHRSAHFAFRANFAPYASGALNISVSWPEIPDDYDLYVFDAEGGSHVSNDFTIDGGTDEAVSVEGIRHCDDIRVEVRNWAGRADQPLTLRIQFANAGPTFACEKDDPHPACAGKLEGEAPARISDTRTRLYLGGDRPGQLAMAGHYPFDTGSAGEPPLAATLSAQRPLGGRTNTYTRPAIGNPEQYQNPFMANYAYSVTQPTPIKGDVVAELWLSSQTFPEGGGPLLVDLLADGVFPSGTRLARVEVPGTAVGTIPTRVIVRFTGLDAVVESELVLQLSAQPVATSGGVVGDPKDAEFTVYYDSVQFPSRLTLDLPAPA